MFSPIDYIYLNLQISIIEILWLSHNGGTLLTLIYCEILPSRNIYIIHANTKVCYVYNDRNICAKWRRSNLGTRLVIWRCWWEISRLNQSALVLNRYFILLTLEGQKVKLTLAVFELKMSKIVIKNHLSFSPALYWFFLSTSPVSGMIIRVGSKPRAKV